MQIEKEKQQLNIDYQNLLQYRGMTEEELKKLMKEIGEPQFRASQLFLWLQNKGVENWDEMRNIPHSCRQKLAERGDIFAPKVITRQESAAHDTVKVLLEFPDGERIETVLMLYHRGESRDRATVCVSTQSGCVMGCSFCVTATVGKGRNLSTAEIVSQVLVMEKEAQKLGFDGVTNIVYMGMGEPALNLENVWKSLQLFNHEKGLNIGMRRMTVSTCGIVPAIYEMAAWNKQVGLAISLHAPDDALREKIMPVARKYKLKELLEAAEHYYKTTGQEITYEYAMFRGINDSQSQAHALGKLLSGKPALVNLIPANLGGAAGFLPSLVETITDFKRILTSYGIEVALREPRGVDIDAACGQLRRR